MSCALADARAVEPRTGVIDRMLVAAGEPVVVVAAPAGYGKTAVLARWAAGQPLPVAWITVDRDDADPVTLLMSVSAGLHHALQADRPADGTGRWRRSVPEMAHRVDALLRAAGPALLVLDQVELLDGSPSSEVVTDLASRLPDGSRLAIATRTQPPLPLARLRAYGRVFEVGVDDLALGHDEAARLLEGAGASLDAAGVADLVERTEGWPVAIHLAGLARALPRVDHLAAVRGDERWIDDFVRSELFGALDDPTLSFVRRTSVLDELNGPLCDAVLDRDGSHAVLDSLRSQHLLVPHDRVTGWYRHRRLVRELLVSELALNEPDVVPLLHARAAEWLEAHREPERAIRHAGAARDLDRTARLIVRLGPAAYVAGRDDDVRSWIDGSRDADKVDRHPDVAVLGALVESSSGRPTAAERWIAAAEAGDRSSAAGGAASSPGWLSYLRAFVCRRGPARMRADARTAQTQLGPASVFYAGALFLEGVSLVLQGEHAAARRPERRERPPLERRDRAAEGEGEHHPNHWPG